MNTSLLERTLKAMIESRDDVVNSIGEIPTYKADYERRVALATAQLAEHDACIKDLKAAIAEQAKPNQYEQAIDDELVNSFLGTKDDFKDAKSALLAIIDWNCKVALDPAVSAEAAKLLEQAKPQEPVCYLCDVVISNYQGASEERKILAFNQKPSFTDGHQVLEVLSSTPLYTRPQALEPMSEGYILKNVKQVFSLSYPPSAKDFIAFARAIEAHHNIGEKK